MAPFDGADDPPQAGDFLGDFSFTFNCSSLSLGKHSVIEPDVSVSPVLGLTST